MSPSTFEPLNLERLTISGSKQLHQNNFQSKCQIKNGFGLPALKEKGFHALLFCFGA
jgi:hypothetical protein